MEQFIYNLNSVDVIQPAYFTDNKILGLSNLMKAIITILPAVYFLYKFYYKKENKIFKSVNEVSNYINEQEKNSAISSVIQGIMLFFFGIKLFFFYFPSKSEISLGILIKYLQKKKIISDDFYEILKKLKPEGMSKYGSQN